MRYWADVQERFPSLSENPVAEADAVLSLNTDPSTATPPNKGGWVLVTDGSLFIGVQGTMGMGRTKSVHRILLDDIQTWKAGQRSSSEYVLTLHDGETMLAAILKTGIGSDPAGVLGELRVPPPPPLDPFDLFPL